MKYLIIITTLLISACTESPLSPNSLVEGTSSYSSTELLSSSSDGFFSSSELYSSSSDTNGINSSSSTEVDPILSSSSESISSSSSSSITQPGTVDTSYAIIPMDNNYRHVVSLGNRVHNVIDSIQYDSLYELTAKITMKGLDSMLGGHVRVSGYSYGSKVMVYYDEFQYNEITLTESNCLSVVKDLEEAYLTLDENYWVSKNTPANRIKCEYYESLFKTAFSFDSIEVSDYSKLLPNGRTEYSLYAKRLLDTLGSQIPEQLIFEFKTSTQMDEFFRVRGNNPFEAGRIELTLHYYSGTFRNEGEDIEQPFVKNVTFYLEDVF